MSFVAGDVGDGAGDAQDFVVGSRRESHLFDAVAEHLSGKSCRVRQILRTWRLVICSVVANRAVARNVRTALSRARMTSSRICRAGRSAGRRCRQFLERHRGNFDVNVDAIHQRPGDLPHVLFDLRAACSCNFVRGSLR